MHTAVAMTMVALAIKPMEPVVKVAMNTTMDRRVVTKVTATA